MSIVTYFQQLNIVGKSPNLNVARFLDWLLQIYDANKQRTKKKKYYLQFSKRTIATVITLQFIEFTGHPGCRSYHHFQEGKYRKAQCHYLLHDLTYATFSPLSQHDACNLTNVK